MSATENKKRTSLAVFALFRLFPTANVIFLACLFSFVVFNGAMILLWPLAPFLFAKWLTVSEPLTNRIGDFLPVVGLTTEFLKQSNGRDLVPAVRNLLSFNFLLFAFFPIPIVLAVFVDLRRGAPAIGQRASKLISKTGRSTSTFVAAAVFIAVLLFLYFFGRLGAKAYVGDLRLLNYAYFGILFWFGDFMISLGAVLCLLACFAPNDAAVCERP
jgi:hypothetical protein